IVADSCRDFTILVRSASSSARLTILPEPRASISRSLSAVMMRRRAPTRTFSPPFIASFIRWATASRKGAESGMDLLDRSTYARGLTRGVGATGSTVGEVCFNTAMTGYEEILTDPSYAAQIVTFTFPHIGVVGVNDEDIEVVNAAAASAAVGAIIRADLSGPSNYRARGRLDAWLKSRGVIVLTGVDTRA